MPETDAREPWTTPTATEVSEAARAENAPVGFGGDLGSYASLV